MNMFVYIKTNLGAEFELVGCKELSEVWKTSVFYKKELLIKDFRIHKAIAPDQISNYLTQAKEHIDLAVKLREWETSKADKNF